MDVYQRPAWSRQVFYDASGNPIDYGNRWPNRIAPEDTYSVVSHPERFAPLYDVADALIEYLRGHYELSVADDLDVSSDLMHERDDVSRAVRLVPANADGAPLSFVFTSFPGLVLHAGLLHDFPIPECGCDACDETPESAVQELESIVFAVVEGRFQEAVRPLLSGGHPFPSGTGVPAPLEIRQQFLAEDGSPWRRGARMHFTPSDRVAAAEQQLRRLPNGWQPWPRP